MILKCKQYQPLLSLYGPGRASLPPSRPPLPPLIGPPLRSSRRPPPPPRDFPVDCSTLIVAPLKLELWSALIAAAASSSRAMWTKPYRFITSHSVTSPKRKNNCRNSSLRQFSGSRPTNIFVFLCKSQKKKSITTGCQKDHKRIIINKTKLQLNMRFVSQKSTIHPS